MLDATLNKRPKQLVFADTIEAEKIEMATQVRAEASVSLPGTPISAQWAKGKVDSSLSFPHSTRLYTYFTTVFVLRNKTVYTEDENQYSDIENPGIYTLLHTHI